MEDCSSGDTLVPGSTFSKTKRREINKNKKLKDKLPQTPLTTGCQQVEHPGLGKEHQSARGKGEILTLITANVS
eukprot:5573020-Heterocapsa_arctica.AAC.1